MTDSDRLSDLRQRFGDLDDLKLLAAMRQEFPGRIAVISSFGAEAAVLLDLVAQVDRSLPVIFLDTDELFDETLLYRRQLTEKLALQDVRVIRPTAEALLAAKELWREDPDACCHLRKVLPLREASQGFSALVDGRKRFHGGGRQGIHPIEIGEDGENQDQSSGALEPGPNRRSLSSARAATPSPGRPGLPVARLLALFTADGSSRTGSGRALGRGGQDRMRHSSGKQILMTSDLDALENQSIFILREAFNRIDKIAMLWSIGKDSNVLLWLARKAFFGHVPFPVVHVDTSYKIPEMIAFRDRVAKEWNLPLIVGGNADALKEGMHPSRGRVTCCSALKTEPLKQIIREHGVHRRDRRHSP